LNATEFSFLDAMGFDVSADGVMLKCRHCGKSYCGYSHKVPDQAHALLDYAGQHLLEV
jgi:hypothetical protein